MDPEPNRAAGDWIARAAEVLPRTSSTGSKRPDAIYGGTEPYGPTHFVRAEGCTVETADGATLIDCTMALGAVALGYADPGVTKAVTETAVAGNVSGLNHAFEVEVAELLCEVVPCAERVQFLKTGAEAVAAAVRLARAFTGRDRIVACGYFGWLDWCSENEGGVPGRMAADISRVPFDDSPALDDIVSQIGTQLAAVVIEPVVEHLPSPEWLKRARQLCDAHGAVLIFDEIKTGFRFSTGGYQQLVGVHPDLATFGKAMANGYPVSAVCGRKDIMNAARDTWISSTLAGEATALAATRAVLEHHRESDVCATLANVGRDMISGLTDALRQIDVEGVRVSGTDHMWLFEFDDPTEESTFLRSAVANGVLFKRGAYNFPAVAHDERTIRKIVDAAILAFQSLNTEPDGKP